MRLLGKKGELTAALRGMKDISEEERPAFGKRVNELRDEITAALEGKIGEIKRAEKDARLVAEKVDVTLPGKKQAIGGLHPLSRIYYEIRDIFVSMGFDVMDGPEVEYDKYNFEMLNIPQGPHPARDTQDTFYVSRRRRAAHAHLAGADTHDAAAKAAHPHDLPEAAYTAATTWTPRTRRCSTRSKAWWWTRGSVSRTLKAHSACS